VTADLIADLEEALRQLEPPFLALPERDETAEALAYRRGARDAYQAVLDALKDPKDVA
jgi:hypothetical protein